MNIVGGCYKELCHFPTWHRIFGSGGRAAIALSNLTPVHFVTYAGAGFSKAARATFNSFGIEAEITDIPENITFSYFHPLSRAHLFPLPPPRHLPLTVKGDIVLRFGLIEGDAIVDGKRVIYDPQGRGAKHDFFENGSQADELVVVLNEAEIMEMTKASSLDEAGQILLKSNSKVRAAVVKRGILGSLVFEPNQTARISPYWSENVFKIGSGDVFSATFAYYWATKNMPPAEAADCASKATSYYVETRNLPIPDETIVETRSALNTNTPGQIYLAGPFFTTAQMWLVEELISTIKQLGGNVFSPYHEVGPNFDARDTATKDLDGLTNSKAVLAVFDGHDPGTLFEIGYARSRAIPVVVLAENAKSVDLTMFNGTDCKVTSDLATAVYQALWASMK